MSQPNEPKADTAPPADEEGQKTTAEPSPTRRLPYEKPVLKRLGSVNKLTLSVSGGVATDGSKTVKMTG